MFRGSRTCSKSAGIYSKLAKLKKRKNADDDDADGVAHVWC